MARYDKYDPKAGGFRAPVAVAVTSADFGKPFGVGIDANGRVVKGAGTSGVVGVMINTKAKAVGDIVDVMTHGEIVEATLSDGTTAIAAGVPGYAVPASGLLSVTATANWRLGHTVEGTRLVVRAGAYAASA